MSEKNLDPIDYQILDQLQANAREAQVDIARAVGLAPSAVLERIRKLESRGIVKGYAAQLNPRSLGLGLLAFVAVRSEEASSDQSIARALADCPEVLEVHHVAGDDCYLIKVRARDAEHLGHAAADALRADPGRPLDPDDDRARDREGNVAAAGAVAGAGRSRVVSPAALRAAQAGLLRLGRGLPDLGHDLLRNPDLARDHAAVPDGRAAVDAGRRAARGHGW